MTDQTQKDPLHSLFDDEIPPSPAAKRRAMDAAMAAFATEQASTEQALGDTPTEKNDDRRQGFWPQLRLSFTSLVSGVTDMNNRLILGGGLAASFALVMTASLLYQGGGYQGGGYPSGEYPGKEYRGELDQQLSNDQGLPSIAMAPVDQLSVAVKENAGLVSTEVHTRLAMEAALAMNAPVAMDTAAPKQALKPKLAAPQFFKSATVQSPAVTGERPAKAERKRLQEIVVTGQKRALAGRQQAEMSAAQMTGGALAYNKVVSGDFNSPNRNTYDRDDMIAIAAAEQGRDRFSEFDSNPIKLVSFEPVSTFSADVDTAAYSFVRRQLNGGRLPQQSAVRVEELINYFDYNYPLAESRQQPFKPTVTVTDSPWKVGNKLVHIGIKGYELPRFELPRSNLVFLLDVSGSMGSADKLPLVKQSMELLLSQLKPDDTVAIVVYAGAAGMVLEPTQVSEKQKILAAMNQLNAGGSTAGGAGIELAYQLAQNHFDPRAVNRIILATDGDFNVGINNPQRLKDFVERKREQGTYLSVLGFGQGNYNDHLMQQLAQNGNGVAAYIDTLSEAQKVLVHQATSSLFTIAKDVKFQLEFNPATVKEYRLLGYETRALQQQDFNNDKVDAGDIGSGHSVTAIYEITPAGSDGGLLEPSRYSAKNGAQNATVKITEKIKENAQGGEYGFLKIRYKLPQQDKSTLITTPILTGDSRGNTETAAELMTEVRFATAVAGFAQHLKGGKHLGNWSLDDAINLAQANKGSDDYGYRTELIQLIRKAKTAKAM